MKTKSLQRLTGLLIILASGALADPAIIDFSGLAHGTVLTDQYTHYGIAISA